MKTRIQDMDIKNKTVVLRCDFNVPIKSGSILDDFKIRQSLETIDYLIDNNCKIVILSHLGKVKSEEDKIKNTLEPVAQRLNELLGVPISFSKQCRNMGLNNRISAMEHGTIMLLENTRTEDYPIKLESTCDTQLAMYWASLGEVFINDAFGSAHRRHASTYGIAKYIPSGIGFLMQKEMDTLDNLILNPEHPFTVVMGGSKVTDKLPVIETLIPLCEYLLLGGGLANAFLDALGLNVGFNDDISPEMKTKLQKIMLENQDKIMLPLDVVTCTSYNKNQTSYRMIDQIEDNDLVYDVGSKTIAKYKLALNDSKTVFVNGTLGVYEDPRFANGTRNMFDLLIKSNAKTIIGGGDSTSAARKFGREEDYTYLCTGGGATLEYITTRSLPALDSIPDLDISEDDE